MTRTRAIIVGAPRSGTTTLWRQLTNHPDIASSKVKELNYLHDPRLAETDYDSHFGPGGKVTLEASPVYFREHTAVTPRIAETFPQARLIFILREPAARLLAGYRSARDWDHNIARNVSFLDFVRIIAEDRDPLPIYPTDRARAIYASDAKKVGIYSDILAHFLEFFSPEQIHILFLDDLQLDPHGALADLCLHLGVDPEAFPSVPIQTENQGVEISNLRFYLIARRINALAEPLLNRAPSLRRAMRRIHHAINARPADRSSEEVRIALSLARNWYTQANHDLAVLLSNHFPSVSLPTWLTEEEN